MRLIPRHVMPLMFTALAFPCHAQTPTPLSVTPQNLRSLLIQALTNPKGEAQAVLSGPEAQALQQRFGSSGPLRIEVRTLKSFTQPGCARLEVAFRQDGVRLPDAPEPKAQALTFSLNYCLDGRPPQGTP